MRPLTSICEPCFVNTVLTNRSEQERNGSTDLRRCLSQKSRGTGPQGQVQSAHLVLRGGARCVPEVGAGGRCRLVVLGGEVAGRWSSETRQFLTALSRAKSTILAQGAICVPTSVAHALRQVRVLVSSFLFLLTISLCHAIDGPRPPSVKWPKAGQRQQSQIGGLSSHPLKVQNVPIVKLGSACPHRRCKQLPQRGCRGSRHLWPFWERKTPKNCRSSKSHSRRPNACRKFHLWNIRSKPQRFIGRAKKRSVQHDAAIQNAQESLRKTQNLKKGADSSGPTTTTTTFGRGSAAGGAVADRTRCLGRSSEAPEFHENDGEDEGSEDAAEIVLERSAKRQALGEDIPRDQQDLEGWLVSKQLELRPESSG